MSAFKIPEMNNCLRTDTEVGTKVQWRDFLWRQAVSFCGRNLFFFLIIYFNWRLITIRRWFLPYIDMNQPILWKKSWKHYSSSENNSIVFTPFGNYWITTLFFILHIWDFTTKRSSAWVFILRSHNWLF